MRNRSSFSLAIVFATSVLTLSDFVAAEDPAIARDKVDFVRDVQPIFRNHCYSCHGGEKQEAGLRLDRKRQAFEGGDGGIVLVPKRASASRLVQIVSGEDEEVDIMPPEGEGRPLTGDQIATLKRWIDQGADWPDSADAKLAASDHWSFQSIRRAALPRVHDPSWPRNEIDRFILARLEKEGFKPSAEAKRATLIRRVYLDLLGIPPTPDEVDQFLQDKSDRAYEQMVDRALESKHYGERWGRHWLDLARYADSDGYEKDRPRPWAWRYRDWVINALNADMPFDQFTIEQIAGDMMLNSASVERQVAVGFHRNTLHNTEGGTDKEEDRVKKTIDRTNTIGTTWLGLTVGCAQCHSHKYDPISQREYYSLYAYFNYIAEKDVPAPTADELESARQVAAAYDREHAKLKEAVTIYEKSKLSAAQVAWESSAQKTAAWHDLKPSKFDSAKGADFKVQPDQSVLVSGKNETSDVYTIETQSTLNAVTAIRLEVLPDKSLAKQGPGRAENGNFVLTTFRLAVAKNDGSDPHPIELASARADFSQNEWQVEKAINSDPKDGWAVSPQIGKRHVALFQLKQPVQLGEDAKLIVTLDQTYHGAGAHNIGRFRLSATDATGAIDLDGLPAAVANALQVAASQRTPAQTKAILDYYRGVDPELKKLQAAVAAHAKKAPGTGKTMAQSVTQQALSTRDTRVFPRGDFLQKKDGAPVTASVPSVLPPLKNSDKADRLAFARWLVDPANPLTARVTVNRIWQRHFGRGIVASSDDFGTQGDPPSHPELLDWLASEFRDSGWRLKHIHRLIVNSATYRQQSALRKQLVDVDPENVLIARQNRMRVEAEIVRDLALAVSGLFHAKIGGPSVRPPQPSEYSALTYANSAKWQTSKGGDQYRRGMYTFFQRTSPYPMLITFDSPDSTECTAQRAKSNTPLQALTIWNDPVFVECAQQLGRRIVNETPQSETADITKRNRAAYAFQLCFSRPPNNYEMGVTLDLYDEQLEMSAADEKLTTAIVGTGALPNSVTAAELSGWIAVGRTLLNLDEFITRE